jgi:hypothetical protein
MYRQAHKAGFWLLKLEGKRLLAFDVEFFEDLFAYYAIAQTLHYDVGLHCGFSEMVLKRSPCTSFF